MEWIKNTNKQGKQKQADNGKQQNKLATKNRHGQAYEATLTKDNKKTAETNDRKEMHIRSGRWRYNWQ